LLIDRAVVTDDAEEISVCHSYDGRQHAHALSSVANELFPAACDSAGWGRSWHVGVTFHDPLTAPRPKVPCRRQTHRNPGLVNGEQTLPSPTCSLRVVQTQVLRRVRGSYSACTW